GRLNDEHQRRLAMTDKNWREEIVRAIQDAELQHFAEEHQLQALFAPQQEEQHGRLSADHRPR
ncbi:hypothetical protein, partial [Escherichia coli]